MCLAASCFHTGASWLSDDSRGLSAIVAADWPFPAGVAEVELSYKSVLAEKLFSAFLTFLGESQDLALPTRLQIIPFLGRGPWHPSRALSRPGHLRGA